jgi:uncharacterized protein (TIGR03067 family)
MRTRFALAVGLGWVAGLAAAPAIKEAAPKPPEIVGEWACEQRLVGGKPDPELAQRPVRLVLSPGKWEAHTPGESPYQAALDLDPKADPPALSLYAADDPDHRNSAKLVGIYRVDGDKLTICYVFDGPRPTQFESAPGSEVRIMTLRRVKAK